MKISVAILVFINILIGSESEETASYFPYNTAYGYFKQIGIPEAKRLQEEAKQMEQNSMLRIFGGERAELGEFIYQAGLIISLFDEENNAVCGGSLISDSSVLTAAHCWNDGFQQGYAMQVVLGTTNVYSGGVRQNTFYVRMHPTYRPVSGTNDIAIVYLTEAVTFTDYIGIIALPSGTDVDETFVGYIVTASGYGRETEDTTVPVTYDLKKLNLTVITNEQCSELQNQTVPDTALCAWTSDGSNVCGGDSGGPLVTTGSEGVRILIGVISHGTTDGCESNIPASYTRVTSFLDWINRFQSL